MEASAGLPQPSHAMRPRHAEQRQRPCPISAIQMDGDLQSWRERCWQPRSSGAAGCSVQTHASFLAALASVAARMRGRAWAQASDLSDSTAVWKQR